MDIFTDFNSADQDNINLSAIDANPLQAGDQAFSFIGTAAFSGTAGELRMFTSGANTIVAGDTTGDGIADFQIQVNGLHNLASSDFVL